MTNVCRFITNFLLLFLAVAPWADAFTVSPLTFVGRPHRFCRFEATPAKEDVLVEKIATKDEAESQPTRPRTLLSVGELKTHRSGAWLPKNNRVVGAFLKTLRERVATSPEAAIVQPVQDLDTMVRADPALFGNAQAMFYEANLEEPTTPLGTYPVQSWEEFIELLNYIVVNVAPEFYNEPGTSEPYGLVGFPINALLDWPMATLPGFSVFSNSKFNTQMGIVLNYWTRFLTSPSSRYTLISNYSDFPAPALPWLDEAVQQELVDVVNQAEGSGKFSTFTQVFKCYPGAFAYGFASWDDFFIREFNEGVRPVSEPDNDNVIVSACESAPLQVFYNASLQDTFWLKNQPYSLEDMINFQGYNYASSFEGGTVYQAFLSALSFHQWRSPISGTVVAAYNIPGTYYLQNYNMGFENPNGADPSAPNDSQPYLSSVATRSVILIKATNAAIGLLCFIGIGMSEVSSCENFVRAGSVLKKGDPLGTFHFGGSTHCLIFQPHVKLDFIDYIKFNASLDSHNVAVSSTIANVKK